MGKIALIFLVFFGELKCKDYVEKNIREGSSKKILHNALILTKHHNRGAAGNLGETCPKLVKLFSILLTAAAALLFILTFGMTGKKLLKGGLALLLGGAFSNTYDRIRRGYVVDYFRLNVPIPPVRRLIFNLSDFCIIIGAMLVSLGYR